MIDKIINDCLSMNINVDQESFTRLNSGLSNIVYLIESSNKVDKYIVKIFTKSKYINRNYENNVMYILNKKKICPKIIIDNEDYRLEEFIDGNTVNLKNMKIKSYSKILINIAKKMFNVHNIKIHNFNFGYKENNIFLKIETFFDILFNYENYSKLNIYVDELRSRLEKDKEKLNVRKTKGTSNEINYYNMGADYIVSNSLIHADLLGDNILCTYENDIKFIDYEYCCVFSRGYDIGNFFNEFKGMDLESSYPDYDVRKLFYYSYFNTVNIYLPDQEKFNIFIKGVDDIILIYSKISDLFWSLWSFVKYIENNDNDFDYLDYALKRLKSYNESN